jgi:signal peptidase II
MVEVPRKGSSWLLKLAIFGLTASMVGCDHATKIAAKAALAGKPAMPIYDGIVELRFACNDDTAFSMLQNLGVPRPPSLLLAMTLLASVGVLVAWALAARKGATTLEHVGFALVVAGALGNVIGRLARGCVVDFIHVARWPIFNVADIAVCVGIGIFALVRLRRARHAPS